VRNKINIAIDGYSSCGKSTIAKAVAKGLDYFYVDSGAMYRAIALYALQNNCFKKDLSLDEDLLIRLLDHVIVSFKYNTENGQQEIYLNGENVEKEIRSIQVSNHVSPVSKIKEVRQKLVRLQKRLAEAKGVVMDGRDIGTVVIPDAELKIFMMADPAVRAQRRFDELKANGLNVTLEEITANLQSRDEMDVNREIDPLRQADDAVVVDNSNLTLEEQYQFVMGQAIKRLEGVHQQ
jgi:cytidylate kinase